jgi:transposase-like protein
MPRTKAKNLSDKLLSNSIKNLRENLTDLSLDDFLKNTIESIMQIERNEYLSTLTNDSSDKGNGFYGRAFNSLSKNSMVINVPRTRKGGLNLNSMELLKLNRRKLDEITLSLYKKGLSFEDIRSFLDEMFDNSVSPSTLSELAKTFHQFRNAWFNSKLEKHYLVVFCDVIFITVKRGNSYSKEGVFIATGVREDLKRELLILDINPTESASNWYEFLLDLRDKRGVKQIDLLVDDGLPNFEGELAKVYPDSDLQKCVVHKIRNVLNKVKPKDKSEISEDIKCLFNNFDRSDTLDFAYEKVELLLNKWSKTYPNLRNSLDPKHPKSNINYYFTYLKYHPRVRRLIYTTNSIENLNRQIRKATKNKLSFESPENLLDYVFMIIKGFEEKNYMKYPVHAYKYFSIFDPNQQELLYKNNYQITTNNL